MNTVTILRTLRRQRALIVLAAVWAVLAGFGVAYRIAPGFSPEPRAHNVALATTRILVDTPSSQVVQVAPKGSDALGVRATLLSNLMVEGVIKTAIARRAGLAPSEFGGVAESGNQAQPDDAPEKPRDYMLTTRVLTNPRGDQLPIIEIEAETPDPRTAEMLANAAVSGLQDYLNSKASDERISAAQRLRVTGLGPAQVHGEVRGPGIMMAFAVMLLVFFVTACAATLLPALVHAWMASSNDDERADGARTSRPPGEAADQNASALYDLFEDDGSTLSEPDVEPAYRARSPEARVEST